MRWNPYKIDQNKNIKLLQKKNNLMKLKMKNYEEIKENIGIKS